MFLLRLSVCFLACDIPDSDTLQAKNIATADPAPGSELNVTANVTMYCQPGLRFSDFSGSKVFSCVACDTIEPAWENCSGIVSKKIIHLVIALVITLVTTLGTTLATTLVTIQAQ